MRIRSGAGMMQTMQYRALSRPAPFSSPAAARAAHPRHMQWRPAPLHITHAKKGKGEKKPAQKKGGSALADLIKKKEQAASQAGNAEAGNGLARSDQYNNPEVLMDLLNICQSYWKHYKE